MKEPNPSEQTEEFNPFEHPAYVGKDDDSDIAEGLREYLRCQESDGTPNDNGSKGNKTECFSPIDWDACSQENKEAGPEFVQKIIYPTDSILAPYMEYARSQIESDDVFIIGSILPVCAAILGRNLYVQWGDTHIYPNLFTMLVASRGTGKARRSIRRQ
jgi:hypothetical protein